MGTRLYVGNLAYSTTEETLRQAFEAGGRKVASVFIATDRETGRPRGFAFVEMASPDDAKAALTAMDGQVLDGRPLRVNEAQERAPRGRGPGGPRPGGYGGGGGGGGDRGGYGGGGGDRGGFGGGGGDRGGFGGGPPAFGDRPPEARKGDDRARKRREEDRDKGRGRRRDDDDRGARGRKYDDDDF
jgi:RNA recognition motif-containing protein